MRDLSSPLLPAEPVESRGSSSIPRGSSNNPSCLPPRSCWSLSIPQTVPGKAGQTRRLNTNQVFSRENSLFSWPLLPSVCLSVLPGWLTMGQRGAYARVIISSSTSFSRRISWHHPPSPARVLTFVPFPAASCLGHFFVLASSPTCATETKATVPGASSE